MCLICVYIYTYYIYIYIESRYLDRYNTLVGLVNAYYMPHACERRQLVAVLPSVLSFACGGWRLYTGIRSWGRGWRWGRGRQRSSHRVSELRRPLREGPEANSSRGASRPLWDFGFWFGFCDSIVLSWCVAERLLEKFLRSAGSARCCQACSRAFGNKGDVRPDNLRAQREGSDKEIHSDSMLSSQLRRWMCKFGWPADHWSQG